MNPKYRIRMCRKTGSGFPVFLDSVVLIRFNRINRFSGDPLVESRLPIFSNPDFRIRSCRPGRFLRYFRNPFLESDWAGGTPLRSTLNQIFHILATGWPSFSVLLHAVLRILSSRSDSIFRILTFYCPRSMSEFILTVQLKIPLVKHLKTSKNR